jgi:hypothetical protein
VDWKKVEIAAEATLGPNSFLYSEKGDCALIIDPASDKTMAIVAEGEDGRTSISFRCSCPPNVVAILTVQLVKSFILTLDRSFEFSKNGEALFGPKAFRYFADNAVAVLFDDEKKQEKIDERLSNLKDVGSLKH